MRDLPPPDSLSNTAPTPEHGAEETELFRSPGLSRREAVALLSMLALGTACGSAAPSDPTPPTTPVPTPTPTPVPVKPTGTRELATQVTLPPGTGLTLTSLRLRALGYPATIDETGRATATISPTYPTLALLVDSDGRGILGAMLDPAASSTASISPRTTAVALAWFALGGPMLRGDTKAAILAQLAVDPAMDTLGTVIATRVAADRLAVVNGDTQIAAALTTAITTMTAATSAALANGISLSGYGHASQLADPPVIVLDPVTEQSNVDVRLATQLNGITLSNSGRRPVRAYVYLVRTRTNNVDTDIVPARLIGTPIDLGEPDVYTATNSIRQLLGQATPFRGAVSPPVALGLDGASEQSIYEIVVIGPSTKTTVPGFFGAARYATHVAGWNAAIEQQFNRIYYCDIIYALILEAGGFSSIVPNLPALALAATEGAQVAPRGAPAAPTGTQLRSQLEASIRILAGDDPSTAYQRAPSIVDQVAAAAMRVMGRVDWNTTIRNGQEFVMRLASPLSNYRPNGTLAKIFDDLERVDRGNLWTATVSQSSATILPANPTASAGEQITLTVQLSRDLTSTYEFVWTNGSATALLLASDNTSSARNITTRQASVTLLVDPDDATAIDLSVQVIDTQGRKLQVARAATQVKILPRAIITPDAAILSVGDRQTYTVTAPITLPTGGKYVWDLTGTAGAIGTANLVTTTVPRIVYTAIRSGTDTLRVQLVDASDKLLASGSVPVRVDPEEYIDFTISGSWDPKKTPPNGRYLRRDFFGARTLSPGGGGLDALFFLFNLGPVDQTIGIGVTILTPTGAPLVAGQSFTKMLPGRLPEAGEWQLTLAVDQNAPDDSEQFAPAGFGTLRFETMTRLSDGRWRARYVFSISNGAGLIDGIGVASWR